MRIPGYVENIISTLEANGFEAYAVGGCVRDYLMGIEPKDYDIATSARPENIKALFRRTFDTGIKHGTVTVVTGSSRVEVTTFRVDGEYLDNRRPESVAFTDELRLDLLRRDFTMNAIAFCPRTGYIDLYDGCGDISRRVIRGVGEPVLRFREDALRMLRAIRFAGQLGFEIEPSTYAAITQCSALIANISAERMRDELIKLLASATPEKITLALSTGLTEHMDSKLNAYLERELGGVLPSVKLCGSGMTSVNLRLALMLRFMAQNGIKRLMTDFRFDNKSIKEVALIAERLNDQIPDDPARIRELLSVIGPDAFRDILYLKRVIESADGGDPDSFAAAEEAFRRIIADGDCVSMSTLGVGGNDLIGLGFKKGKALGDALNALLKMVLRNPAMNDKRILLDEAARILSETS